jgi:protease-4
MSQLPRNAATTGYALALAAAVLVSAVLAPVAYGAMQDSTDQSVAVVQLSGGISAYSVDQTIQDLREVRRNDSVGAVVLEVNSPGGGVAASERLYLAVQKTAEAKPVVASVQQMGASGGYMAMLPAERIYTLPSGIVGSVGVYATTTPPFPDSYVRSGPDKATRSTEQTRRQVELLQERFLDTVFKHREGRLELSRAELAHGKAYVGTRAVSNGVADEVGTLRDAVDYAAQEAGLEEYAIHRKEPPARRGVILLGQGENRTVVLDENAFRYDDVRTTQFMALHGQVRPESEVTTDASG